MDNKPDPLLIQIVGTDRIIHEPARVAILALLNAVEAVDFTFLLNETGMSQGNLSSHLNKLEIAGYIDIRKTFMKKRPRTIVSMSKKGSESFRDYVESMKDFYNSL